MKLRTSHLLLALSLVLMAAASCSAPSHLPRASEVAPEPWEFDGRQGSKVRTDHYLVHTTIENRSVTAMLAQVMEGALAEYQQFTPGLRLSARPLECYVFAERSQWARFTRERTGADAPVYLKINRGGYTVRDWYVAYFIGDVGTYAVAAHEGWHQYVARHFKSRMPPFLEEGIATMFETISWTNGRPRWSLAINPSRAHKLRRALEQESLWPLEKLVTMHAGDVVNLPGERIETFYAQNWAFAQFLWEGDDRRHRPALQRMLADLAAGDVPQRIVARRGPSDLWDPSTARPLLEHYLGMSFDEIERSYLAYVRRVAQERGGRARPS